MANDRIYVAVGGEADVLLIHELLHFSCPDKLF